jgi:hypothetical protein
MWLIPPQDCFGNEEVTSNKIPCNRTEIELSVIFFGWFYPRNKASSQWKKKTIENSQKCVKNSQLAGLLFSTKQNNELTKLNDNLENLMMTFKGIKKIKLWIKFLNVWIKWLQVMIFSQFDKLSR